MEETFTEIETHSMIFATKQIDYQEKINKSEIGRRRRRRTTTTRTENWSMYNEFTASQFLPIYYIVKD